MMSYNVLSIVLSTMYCHYYVNKWNIYRHSNDINIIVATLFPITYWIFHDVTVYDVYM